MAVRQYVGARYVPKFAYPVAWQAGTSYEALTIVTYNNSSYTSKIPVPATVGNPADNDSYWALTGNYNAQVEDYRQTALQTQENLTEETNAREQADTTLGERITQETNAREQANTAIQVIKSDFYAPVSPVENKIHYNTPNLSGPQGATMVNGIAYLTFYDGTNSYIYKYENFLEGDSTPVLFVTMNGVTHPNSINYYNGFLYVTDSDSGNIYPVDINTGEIKTAFTSNYHLTNAYIYLIKESLMLFGEDFGQDILSFILIEQNSDGTLTMPTNEHLYGYTPTNNRHNYSQDIGFLSNGLAVVIRSFCTTAPYASYLMIINPTNAAERLTVAIPYEGELEGVFVYQNKLYIVGANNYIYDMGSEDKYSLQFNGRFETQYLTGVHYQYFKNIEPASLPIDFDFATANGMLRFDEFYTKQQLGIKFVYPAGKGDNAFFSLTPALLTDVITSTYRLHGNGTIDYLQLNVQNVPIRELHIRFQGATINGTNYSNYDDLPADSKPEKIYVYITA